ncbi:MAG: diguanylate cyclase (GGDEF)-like protein [Sulfurimonas sp.]|jgi:diguanylate cyclase (GGDEF)-like protein
MGDIHLISKIIPKTGKHHYRFVLTMVLVFLSLVVLTMSLLVTAYFQLSEIHKEFDASAKDTLAYKQNFLYSQTNNLTNYFTAVEKTLEFESFLQGNSDSKEHLQSIMMAMSYSNPNIMQFRFLDKLGHEKIRIDKKNIAGTPYKLTKDKSKRYYFTEIKNIGEGKVWFSKIDLNMEHGKIVEPIIPILRVAKSYYVDGEFKGVLIINIFMEDILDEVMKSELFNIAIIDKDSYLLSNNLDRYNAQWSRYLNKEKEKKYTINNNTDNFLLELIFKKKNSTLNISDIIKNNEGLKIVIEEKSEKIIEYAKSIINYMMLMGLIVFVISVPIAILLSRNPLKLHEKLEKSRDDLKKQLDIIDRYVYMSITDLDGNITDVSTAFTRLSGKDWSSTLKNISKNGKKYWVKKHVSPILKEQKISGFTAIREDITAQKAIGQIAMKDELTGAYNRRFLNIVFTKELHRAKRKDDLFSIAMFDIDYFKNFNDTYGHIKGDEALQDLVSCVNEELQRGGDYLFRVGGEEFIIIYSDMKSFEDAKEFSSKIVKKIENMQINHKTSECSDYLTISLGLLTITTQCTMDEKKILQHIDELLYSAKYAGRNQLVAQKC